MSRVEAFDHAQQPARLCLPRVRAKIISANISWKEGKNGGSGKKVIMREAEFSFNIYTDNNETVK